MKIRYVVAAMGAPNLQLGSVGYYFEQSSMDDHKSPARQPRTWKLGPAEAGPSFEI